MLIQQGHSPFIEAPEGINTSGRANLNVVRPLVEPHRQRVEPANWERRYSSYLRVTDAVVVCSAVLLAQYVRFGSPPVADSTATHRATAYSAVLAIIWLVALAGLRSRSPKYVGAGIEEYRRVVAASFWTFGAVAIAELLMKLEVSRGYLSVALPVGIVGLVLSRWQWRGFVYRQRRNGSYSTSVLAIGDRDAVANLADELTSSPDYGYHVVGVAIPGYGAPCGEHLTVNGRQVPIIGGEGHVLEAISSRGADKVAIAGTDHFGVKGIRRLIWELEPMGVELVVSPGVMDVARSRLAMRPIAGLPLLYIDKPQYQGAKRFQKRAFDFTFALAALTVSLPLLLVAGIAVKMTNKGPVFYKAERIGIDGKPFMMLKFRTMVEDADKMLQNLFSANESDGLLFKIKNDPRITPVGRILRRFSIDELPQFINVLRQEMSVVGPRPPLRREVEAYDDDVQRRLLVKPGVTGLWQVSGRSDLPWDKAVRLDLSYVDNWSMVGDILIIAKTLRAGCAPRGLLRVIPRGLGDMQMRALVTGAAGFIGSTLVDRLLHEGHQVVGIDNLSTGVLANLDEPRRSFRLNRRRFTFVQSDIRAPELTGIVAGSNPDVIFHLAAQLNLRASVTDPLFDARNNVLGTINVLEAARHSDIRRIVYAASGGSRYGAPVRLPADESLATDPISPYAVAKLAGELYLRAYAEMYGISPICLALANVYGPRQNPHGEAGVITVFGRAMITDSFATDFGDGSAARDYVYVDDVVDAFMRAGEAPHSTFGTYNIGTGRQATVLEVHRLIAEILGSSSSPCYATPRSGELQAIALDSTKAENELGWTPRVELPDGIERTIGWLRTALKPEPAAFVSA